MTIQENDHMRKRIPFVDDGNMAVYTRGIAAMEPTEIADIILKVKQFNDFTEDNDPWKEYDFGYRSGLIGQTVSPESARDQPRKRPTTPATAWMCSPVS